MNQIDVLIDIAKKLDRSGISYMLTGSFAMNYYAEPRMTRDIDIVIDLREGAEEKFINLFKEDYYIPEETVKKAIFKRKMFNIIHTGSVVKVDFIIRKNSEYRQVEFERRQKISVNNRSIYIVSKEDLMISKVFWAKDSNSDLQKNDIKNLVQSGYDKDYLEKWLKKLGIDKFFKEFIDG